MNVPGGISRFIIRCSMVAICVIALAAAAEIWMRSQPSPYSFKNDKILNDGKCISTIILGTSHAYYGIMPRLLGDSAFNLANVSQLPDQDEELLRKNIDKLPNLKRVILGVSYFPFETEPLETSMPVLVHNYKVFMGIGDHGALSKYNFLITHFSSFRDRVKYAMGYSVKVNHCDSTGFGLGHSLAERNPEWAVDGPEVRAQSLTRDDPASRARIRSLYESMIRLAQNHGAEVTLVTLPADSSFIRHADPKQVARMRKEARRLSEKYNVPYLDFFESPLFSGDDFFDSDHLSEIGAEKFTRLLADTLKNIRRH